MKKKREPPSDLQASIHKGMEVTKHSAEGALYLAVQTETMAVETGLREELSAVVEATATYAALKRLELEPADSWNGQAKNTSDVQKSFRIHEAEAVAASLPKTVLGKANNVVFGYAITEDSEILRGYTADGKSLDGNDLVPGDKSFAGFLAKNNIVSNGSVLYEAVADGEPSKRVDPQKARDIINDPDTGYAQHMKTKGVKMTCSEQRQAPAAQQDMQAQQAIKDVAAVRESLGAEAGVEPEAPTADVQSTMRAGG